MKTAWPYHKPWPPTPSPTAVCMYWLGKLCSWCALPWTVSVWSMRYCEYFEGAEGVNIEGTEHHDRHIVYVDLFLDFDEQLTDVFELNSHLALQSIINHSSVNVHLEMTQKIHCLSYLSQFSPSRCLKWYLSDRCRGGWFFWARSGKSSGW